MALTKPGAADALAAINGTTAVSVATQRRNKLDCRPGNLIVRLLPLFVADAMTTAARTILVALYAVVFVDTRLVVPGVTASAGRLIARRRPVHGIGVRAVTVGAVKVSTMIQRLVGKPEMTIVCGRPAIRRMTKAAILRRVEVARIHSSRCRAVMAGRAGANNLVVVNGHDGREDGSAMAILAYVACERMRRALSRCVTAVVTIHATIRDVGVIEVRRSPGNGRVAIIAIIAAGNMRRMLARCGHAVMTGLACTDHLRVVNREWRNPDVRPVAILTDVAGVDMSNVLAGRIAAVVATAAATRDVGMIESCRSPGDACMAVIAIVSAFDMCWILTGGHNAVMTGLACAKYLRVIDRQCRHKGIGCMTVFTDVAGIDMGSVFARRINSVMATHTIAGDIDVIEIRR